MASSRFGMSMAIGSISREDEKKVLSMIIAIVYSRYCIFGFSFQIGSIENGLAAVVLFGLYLRGYLKWKKEEKV